MDTSCYLQRLTDIAQTYSNNIIYILGTNASADELDASMLSGALVIGLDDAERVYPVDITILHHRQVAKRLARSDFRSQLYICDAAFPAAGRHLFIAEYRPLDPDNADLMLSRLMSDDIVLEDLLFLTGLKIAKHVAQIRQAKQTVYLVGCDFDDQADHGRRLADNSDPGEIGAEKVGFAQQDHYFPRVLCLLQKSSLSLQHVGSKPFSVLTASELNAICASQKDTSLASRSSQVLVVAEISTNHFGDRSRLEKLVRLSYSAGANLVKLQKRHVATFYSNEQLSSPYSSPYGRTFGDYREQLRAQRRRFPLCGPSVPEARYRLVRVSARPKLVRFHAAVQSAAD